MKYLAFFIFIATIAACNKSNSKNATPGPGTGPTDTTKMLPVYRYIGVLRSVGYIDAQETVNLDTSMVDTVYVTVLGRDSLRVRERFFSYNDFANGHFPIYYDSTNIVLRADSSYHYHEHHYEDSIKLDGSAQRFFRNNYHITGTWGSMNAVFSGTKQ